jgi:hypothetical protein
MRWAAFLRFGRSGATRRTTVDTYTETETETRTPARRPERSAFSIQEFCWRQDFGLGTYHKIKRAGKGPDELRIGNVIRITSAAERKWQRERTYPKGAEAKARTIAEAKTKARGRKAGKLAAASPLHVSQQRKRASASA